MIRVTSWATALVLLSSLAANAQNMELSGTAGITLGVALEKRAPELEDVKIADGFTFAFQAARFLTPHWAVEGQWSEQFTGFEISSAAGSARLYDMSVSHLHGEAVYDAGAPGSALHPFLLAGIGATFFRGTDLPSESKLSWSIGAGIKYFPWKTIGFRGQARYLPIHMNDSAAGQFCDAFGFCQGTFRQFDVGAGVVLRF